MRRGDSVHHSIADNVNLGLAVGYVSSVLAGVRWTDAAAVAACIYSMLLIVEKLHRWFKRWKEGAQHGSKSESRADADADEP